MYNFYVLSLMSQSETEKEECSCGCKELPGKHSNFYSYYATWLYRWLTLVFINRVLQQLLGRFTGKSIKLHVKEVFAYSSRGIPARWSHWMKEDHCLIILAVHLTLCVISETGLCSEYCKCPNDRQLQTTYLQVSIILFSVLVIKSKGFQVP